MSTPLNNNTERIRQLIIQIENLPDAGCGGELPTLTNPGADADLVEGKQLIGADGSIVTGSMPNNGAMSKTMDGVNTKSISVPAGYTSGGTVSLDSTIDNAVAAMKTALTSKGVTVPADADVVDIASLISAIESGGVGGSGDFKGVVERTATTITIPDNVTKIGKYAFYRYSDLLTISIGNGVTSIDDSAFVYCGNLQTVFLGNNVTSIGVESFYGCDNLVTISIPSGLSTIKNYAFNSCSVLSFESLPSGLSIIGDYAFNACLGLRNITFQSTPTSIGPNAFRHCSNLTIINVPWAEGEVSGAPWGATNATINYNYTGG